MMKFILIAVLVIFAVASTNAFQCDGAAASTELKDQMTMNSECFKATRIQIQLEIAASIQYLAMGAHFSKDTVNLPGFADFFFKAANEEREHATKLIEYLLMRTDVKDVKDLIVVKQPTNTTWESGLEALKGALKKEVIVTDSIRGVIKKCEEEDVKACSLDAGQPCATKNDYHFVDYLTGEFLDEQYKGQRELAGKISTLSKMMESNHNAKLAEFLFDKQLL